MFLKHMLHTQTIFTAALKPWSTKPVYLLNVRVCDVSQKLVSSNDSWCKLHGARTMWCWLGDDMLTTFLTHGNFFVSRETENSVSLQRSSNFVFSQPILLVFWFVCWLIFFDKLVISMNSRGSVDRLFYDVRVSIWILIMKAIQQSVFNTQTQ